MSTVALTEAALLRAALHCVRLDYETQTEAVVSDAARFRLARTARAFVAAVEAEQGEDTGRRDGPQHPSTVKFEPVADQPRPAPPAISGVKTTNALHNPPPGHGQRP